MSSRNARLLIAMLLLAIVLFPRWLYGTWDTCEWLRSEAVRIAWNEAGLPEDELPDSEDPRYDWWFARTTELIEPYHLEGQCLQRWARLRLLRSRPVVAETESGRAARPSTPLSEPRGRRCDGAARVGGKCPLPRSPVAQRHQAPAMLRLKALSSCAV